MNLVATIYCMPALCRHGMPWSFNPGRAFSCNRNIYLLSDQLQFMIISGNAVSQDPLMPVWPPDAIRVRQRKRYLKEEISQPA